MGGVAQFGLEGIFALGNKFGSPNCSPFAQRANSARRNACFLPSGGIRLAELPAFGSAEEFDLPNGSLFVQRANSACRNARF